MPPREIFKMRTLGDAFSLILGAKSRAFRTDVYQVTGNKVMTETHKGLKRVTRVQCL